MQDLELDALVKRSTLQMQCGMHFVIKSVLRRAEAERLGSMLCLGTKDTSSRRLARKGGS